MTETRPIVGITMGDPVGIGPEILMKSLSDASLYEICRPLVIGDANVLSSYKNHCYPGIRAVDSAQEGKYVPGSMDVIPASNLVPDDVIPGHPTPETGTAMIRYITQAIDMALVNSIHAMVTAPINKAAMKLAGSRFYGHTELLAARTHTRDVVMMMAGDRLRVVLVTIHIPFQEVIRALSIEHIKQTIDITHMSLMDRFGLAAPRIAVAGLNPHAGEGGLFGCEEADVIVPAIDQASRQGIQVCGPFPPDTVFYQAAKGEYDAVVSMYHDQGLIPFKLIHFKDGVNTTLGLPIIRTSVDHGTAYDIAGTGKADSGSMVAAIRMAASQAGHLQKTIDRM